MQFNTQQTHHLLTLIVIQASALPGLLYVIALTGNGLNCWAEDRHRHKSTVQKSHEEILTAEWRTFASGPILH